MEYLHKFETETQCESYMNGSDYKEPFVGLVTETSEILYNKFVPPHDYSQDYLTFNIISGGTITWTATNSSNTKTISYSIDGGSTWTDITSSTSDTSINVSTGDKVMFKGNNSAYGEGIQYNYNYFRGAAKFDVEGNIMSLVDSTGFRTATTLTSDYTFDDLFNGCTRLISAENLVLPATTLTKYCYSSMFSNCTGLTTAPELPATTLVNGCYDDMFHNCPSLTTAPELPATILANSCYGGMFDGCTSLTTAPILPATTLVNGCYQYMFHNCSSLTTVPSNYLPATTLANYCYHMMFQDCIRLTTAPELPATTLAKSCYYCMFDGCTSLNYVKCLATDISATDCKNYWVRNVSSTGTFVKNPNMSSWTTGSNGIPEGWTVQDATE